MEEPTPPSNPATVDTRELTEKALFAPHSKKPADFPQLPELPVEIGPSDVRENWLASIGFMLIDGDTQLPVENVRVTLVGPIRLPPAFSNTDGVVNFIRLPAGDYYFQISHDKYGYDHFQHDSRIALMSGAHEEVLVELQPACRATGRVISAKNGQPLASVRVYPNRYEAYPPIVTGSDGKFDLPTGEALSANIYLQADGFTPQEIYQGCVNGKLDLGDIVLSGEWVLKGKVVDQDGEPLPGVTVQDYPREEETTPPGNMIETLTDTNGRFSLAGLPGTEEQIYFYKQNYADQTANVNASTGEDFTVVMLPECTIDGRIVDSKEMPVEGVRVAAMGRPSMMGAYTVTDAEGKFRLDSLKPGKQDISLSALSQGGSVWQSTTVECVNDKNTVKITLDIEEETLAEGIVLDSDGVPAEKAFVSVFPESGGFKQGQVMRYSTTDLSGQFKIAVPTEGKYRIGAFAIQKRQRGNLEGLEGRQSNLKIKMSSFNMFGDMPVSGTVVDGNGEPVLDYRYCWWPCRQARAADEEGRWERQDGMPVELQPLYIFLPDGRIGRSGEMPEGTENVVVSIGDGAAIAGELGDGFDGGLTVIQLSAGRALIGKLTVERDFRFPLVPPGSYTLQFIAPGGKRLDREHVVVLDGEPVDLGVVSFPLEED